jgi:hypothetical protein
MRHTGVEVTQPDRSRRNLREVIAPFISPRHDTVKIQRSRRRKQICPSETQRLQLASFQIANLNQSLDIPHANYTTETPSSCLEFPSTKNRHNDKQERSLLSIMVRPWALNQILFCAFYRRSLGEHKLKTRGPWNERTSKYIHSAESARKKY